jgi:hypothetical protein
VLRIVMSNPGSLNSADAIMHRELAEIWRDVDADPDVRCAILTGDHQVDGAAGRLGDLPLVQPPSVGFARHSAIADRPVVTTRRMDHRRAHLREQAAAVAHCNAARDLDDGQVRKRSGHPQKIV